MGFKISKLVKKIAPKNSIVGRIISHPLPTLIGSSIPGAGPVQGGALGAAVTDAKANVTNAINEANRQAESEAGNAANARAQYDEITQRLLAQLDTQLHPDQYLTDQQKLDHISTANRLAQGTFGNSNDQDLIGYLSGRLAKGDSPYELSQFLQTTPQYLKKQADDENTRVQQESAAARQALDQQLQQSQQQVFSRAIPNIISSYMRAGRLNSSGLNSALANAQADLERERQGYLANAGYNDAVRAQGYQRDNFVANNNAAFQNYLRQSEPSYQQNLNLQNIGNQLKYQQPYQSLNRQYQLEDYQQQRNDYNNYLNISNKQNQANAIYGLVGSVLGAGAKAGMSGLFGGG
jgi:hypothetical protein